MNNRPHAHVSTHAVACVGKYDIVATRRTVLSRLGVGWIMRSARLLGVAVLAVLLAASSFSPVFASGYIAIHKVTTNGDTTTWFYFDTDGPGLGGTFILVGGASNSFSGPASGWFPEGEYTFTEDVPAGWVLAGVDCADTEFNSVADFDYIPGGVTITLSGCGAEGCSVLIDCTFTNSPAAVGGVVTPTNMFAIVAPWLAVIGLLGCIATVAVVVKKRRQ